MIKAVIFDLDGTLLDTEPINQGTITHCLQAFGVQPTADDLLHAAGQSPRNYLGALESKYATTLNTDEFHELFTNEYNTRWRIQARLYPDVHRVLSILAAREVPMCLATSCTRDIVEEFLDKFDTRKYFSCSVAGLEAGHKKPHPAVYERAVELLGLPKQQIIAVEDSAVGVASAHGAGLRVYAIPNEHTKHHDFSNATGILTSLHAVLDIVR